MSRSLCIVSSLVEVSCVTAISSGRVPSGLVSMEITHIDVEPREHRHRLFDGIRDIVQLEVKEYLMPSRFDLSDYLRAFGVEKLHSYFDKRLPALESVEEIKAGLFICKIAGYYDIFTHQCAPPIISFKLFMPYFSIALGRSSIILLQA